MTDILTFIRSYDEAGTVRTFVFEPADLEWLPGQYQYYTLPQAGETEEQNSRFFTIASAPSEHEIHISTRVTNSAFKQALNALQPGDTIARKGLEGDFTWDDESDAPVVLVAAGIGSTPYRSMLLERHATGKPLAATILYYTRDEQIPFKAEFDALLAQHDELTIHYIIGQPVTAESIVQYAPQVTSQVTYISGPEPMVDTIGDELKSRGVNLKQDWFPGYDQATF